MRATDRSYLFLAVVLLFSHAAKAGPADEPSAASQPTSQPTGAFLRPRLTDDAQPRYPQAAWDEQREADVVILMTIDETGRVIESELAEPAGHGFDEEALAAARRLRFSPALLDDAPTRVTIRYTFRFRIPEKETISRQPLAECQRDCPTDARKKARLAMTVFERGKGKPLAGVEVYLLDLDKVFLTDSQGHLELDLAPGAWAITIRPPDFYPFETTERLGEGEALTVRYHVRKNRRARYQTLVWGTEGRAEVARTSLVDDEIRAIPGTQGDPVRVMMLLPGVTSSVSGLGYPIIRGALPGDSLYEIDGIAVPMLYHLMFGTAVIHPRFTDEITFQPGGYSVEEGRFPGGRIAATTARVEDDPVTVADLSLVQGGLFHSRKVGERGEVVAAARYGTLGYLIEGINSNVVFRYWDAQARAAWRLRGGGRLSLTLLGVEDAAGERDPQTGTEHALHVGFARADLAFRQAFTRGWLQAGVQAGDDFFRPPPDDASDGNGSQGDVSQGDATKDIGASAQLVRPYLRGGLVVRPGLELTAGADLLYQDFGLKLGGAEDTPQPFLGDPQSGLTLGAWLGLEWKRGRLLVNPGVRLDHYRYVTAIGVPQATSIDPRLSIAYEVGAGATLKASAGLFHGPPHFSFVDPPIVFGPIPAFDGMGLEYGLTRAMQLQVGVEAALPRDLRGSVTGFYHGTAAPIDFGLIDRPLAAQRGDPCAGTVADPSPPLPTNVAGRAVGAEFLLRRRLGKAFFGWLSYAWSRSERTVNDVGTFPSDFDQTHVMNLVLSWDVGRNWTVGSVFHYNTGRPYTPSVASRCGDGWYAERRGPVNSARLPSYWRLDLRVQKREVFETWFFDFYIDFFNAALTWETIAYEFDPQTGGETAISIPLFLPMLGIRGEF